MKTWSWTAVVIFVRLVSILLIQSSFVADEYWQSVEVAHQLAFGFGYRTWEWREGIRSYLFPACISVLFKTLQFLHLDYRNVLIVAPRVLVALLSAAGDISVVEVSRRTWGPRAAAHTAFCLATSWCLFYCGSRTLANTVETALVAIALRYYPWQRPHVAARGYLYMGALAAALRPTSALVWLPLWLADFRSCRNRRRLVAVSAAAGVAALLVCFAVDSVGHGAPLLTPLRFLRWNVLGGIASHYGTSPWHAHLTTSLPTLLTTHTLALVPALKNAGKQERLCATVVVWLIAVYSVLPHKEFRFLLPVWPFCALLAGRGLLVLQRANDRCCSLLKVLIVVTNLPAALYLGLVHQRGPLDVTACLAARLQHASQQNVSVLYLTPCHSTPLYSHLHLNVSARFLTCEPNLSAAANYTDEADAFYQNPEGWLRSEYPELLPSQTYDSTVYGRNNSTAAVAGSSTISLLNNTTKLETQSATAFRTDDMRQSYANGETLRTVDDPESRRYATEVLSGTGSYPLPTHIVMFDTLWAELSTVLRRFSVCEDVFHAHFYEPRRARRLLVVCREDWLVS